MPFDIFASKCVRCNLWSYFTTPRPSLMAPAGRVLSVPCLNRRLACCCVLRYKGSSRNLAFLFFYFFFNKEFPSWFNNRHTPPPLFTSLLSEQLWPSFTSTWGTVAALFLITFNSGAYSARAARPSSAPCRASLRNIDFFHDGLS